MLQRETAPLQISSHFFVRHLRRRYQLRVGLNHRSYSTSGTASTWMGNRLQTGKPSRYVTSHPYQLSLAIRLWVGAISTSESWLAMTGFFFNIKSLLASKRHTARYIQWYTIPVSVVSQCKLVSGWGIRKRRSAPTHGPCSSGRTLLSVSLSPPLSLSLRLLLHGESEKG